MWHFLHFDKLTFCEQKFNCNLFPFELWRKNNKLQLSTPIQFSNISKSSFYYMIPVSSHNAPSNFILYHLKEHNDIVLTRNINKSFENINMRTILPICHPWLSWAKKGAKNTWHTFLLTLYIHYRAISYRNHLIIFQILAKFIFYDVFFCVFLKKVTIW